MPNKKKCLKCRQKHFLPTCIKFRLTKDSFNKDSESDMSLIELSMLRNKKTDSDISALSDSNEDSSDTEDNSVPSQILKGLQRG